MVARRLAALLLVAGAVALAYRIAATEFGDSLLAALAGTLAMLPALVAVAPLLDYQSKKRMRSVSRLRSPSRA